jgi:hypothetical protein
MPCPQSLAVFGHTGHREVPDWPAASQIRSGEFLISRLAKERG